MQNTPATGGTGVFLTVKTNREGKALVMNTTLRQRNPHGWGLLDVLSALGHKRSDRISINTKAREGQFSSRLLRVDELTGWKPPRDRDVWFGVNPMSRGVPRGRGTEADVSRVRVLFADLDVKAGSLASIGECEAVVRLLSDWLECEPAARIYSGHGLQPLWRVGSTAKCSNVIRSDGAENPARLTRDGWRELYQRWGGLVQRAVREVRDDETASIDNVYDLSRILRCPGSVNRKARPVAVRTEFTKGAGQVSWQRLRAVLDANETEPLKNPSAVLVGVPTDRVEATHWINNQPGADAEPAGMSLSMLKAADYDGLVREFASGAGGDLSAHSLMLRKVQHVVLLSTEGNAGLILALSAIERAYRKVMELRRDGRAAGDARSDAVALGEYQRAVTGAVGKGRTRHNAPLPLRDWRGRIRLPVRGLPTISATAADSSGAERHRSRVVRTPEPK